MKDGTLPRLLREMGELKESEVVMGLHDIGTREWFAGQHQHGPQGTIDWVLFLLEKEEITRAKARELIEFATRGCYDRKIPTPTAPWDKAVKSLSGRKGE